MSDGDTPLWLDAFPHDFTVAHERTLRGMSKVKERVYYPGASRDGGHDGAWLRITAATGRVWTGVFASDLGRVGGRLSLIASWPEPSTLFVSVGGGPYLVDTRDPDAWSRLERPTVRRFWPVPGLALLLDDVALSAYDAAGLAWESDPLPGAEWLGVLDDEVHLRAGDVLHRVSLRHGGTTTEPVSW